MGRSVVGRLGYVLARSAFQELKDRMDPRQANGGVFLGLNGIVIKSHGGTDAEGFAAAIEVGYGVVRDELLAKITTALGRMHEPQQAVGGAAS
jgi:glycerol-3-phosphate acyltransferase PlsX